MASILITGVNGFIGQRLLPELLRAGHRVVGTGRQASPPFTPPAGFEYRQADLTDRNGARQACANIDVVIHCAGKAGAWGAEAGFRRANVDATEILLEVSRASGTTRFINLSSPSIYFDYRHQYDLKENQRPITFSNAYASTKYDAEQLVSAAHHPNFWTLSLRPRGVLGAGDRNWLPRIIDLRQKNRLVQIGDGATMADFTSVTNLVQLVGQLVAAPESAFGRVYNITNGKPERLWDVIEAGLAAVSLDSQRKRIPLPIMMAVASASDVWGRLTRSEKEPALLPVKVGVAAFSMTLDISAAKQYLGYQPRATTADAIQEFATWWQAKQS